MKTTALLAVSVVAILGAILWLRQKDPAAEKASSEPEPAAESVESDAVVEPPAEVLVARAPTLAAVAEPEPESDATETSDYDPHVHPHPITPEHLRIYREADLHNSAWLALKNGDIARTRELVAEHQRDFPDVNSHMDEGLLVLADCLERPGPETKARAQKYYDTYTYSQMRRRIRKMCLQVVPD